VWASHVIDGKQSDNGDSDGVNDFFHEFCAYTTSPRLSSNKGHKISRVYFRPLKKGLALPLAVVKEG